MRKIYMQQYVWAPHAHHAPRTTQSTHTGYEREYVHQPVCGPNLCPCPPLYANSHLADTTHVVHFFLWRTWHRSNECFCFFFEISAFTSLLLSVTESLEGPVPSKGPQFPSLLDASRRLKRRRRRPPSRGCASTRLSSMGGNDVSQAS